jgi:beta-lactamase superfamily II metal-dependent hydrolase
MKKIKLSLSVLILATLLIATLFTSGCSTTPEVPETLDIYFVDVEGGQATLIIMPDGETLLIDAGYPGQGKSDPTPGEANKARDAQRIAAAAADANISKIDYLLVSHFHRDHFGGAMELARLMPIGTILDHGTEVEKARSKPTALELILAYEKTREQHDYIMPSVGDRLPLKSAQITIVSSAGTILDKPLADAGGINSSCGKPEPAPGELSENSRSTGIFLRYGEFRFLDVGDLIGKPLSDLVCPVNRIGPVDVYLVPHHGGTGADDPATLAAFQPRVAILNNGAAKGGAAATFDVLHDTDGLEDVWQLHWSEVEDAENFSPDRIANLDTQTEHWLKLSAKSDGSFRILNPRTGEWRNYTAR